MSPEESQFIELACTRLVYKFSHYNDNRDFKALSGLFTENGAFARPTDPDNFVEGRANILTAFEARPHDRITRHVISNVIIDVKDEQSATGTCYATLFMAPIDAEKVKFGVQANSSQMLGEFNMVFSFTEQGWKIASQTGKIIFTT